LNAPSSDGENTRKKHDRRKKGAPTNLRSCAIIEEKKGRPIYEEIKRRQEEKKRAKI